MSIVARGRAKALAGQDLRSTSHRLLDLIADGYRGPLHALGRPHVAALLTWRQLDLLLWHRLVGHQAEEMADEIEMRAALVVGLDDIPGSLLDVRVREHLVLGLGVVDPSRPGLQVHRAQLPTLAGVVDPRQETALLLFVADRKPVLD